MQLVKSRPIALPVFKSGKWHDDFAVTGAVDPGYTLTAGTKDKMPYGIRLRATGGLNSSVLNLPTWFKAPNFEAETVCRLVAGLSVTALEFRTTDANNRIYVHLLSAGELQIKKAVTGVFTVLASLTGLTATDWQRINIRAVGSLIDVCLNGRTVFAVNETDLINYNLFRIQTYDATVDTAQSDFQYLAINPL